MTSDNFTVTDAEVKRALDELAAGPDGDLLVADVMRVVDTTPQARGSAWRVPWMTSRVAVIAASVLLLVAIGGAAVLLSEALPEPRPPGTPGMLDLPGMELGYVIPENSGLGVHVERLDASWYQFSEITNPHGPGPTIDVFPAEGDVHPCPMSNGGSSRVPIRSSPQGFLEDLREIAGTGIVGETATTLDGYPAWSAELEAGEDRCGTADLHIPPGSLGDVPAFTGRSGTFTVVDVNGSSIAILISAQPDDLQAFLPVGDAFVSSIDLVEARDQN